MGNTLELESHSIPGDIELVWGVYGLDHTLLKVLKENPPVFLMGFVCDMIKNQKIFFIDTFLKAREHF